MTHSKGVIFLQMKLSHSTYKAAVLTVDWDQLLAFIC